MLGFVWIKYLHEWLYLFYEILNNHQFFNLLSFTCSKSHFIRISQKKLAVTLTLYVHTCFCSMRFADWARTANCTCENCPLCTNVIYSHSTDLMVVMWKWTSVMLYTEARPAWQLVYVRTLGALISPNGSAACLDRGQVPSRMGWPLVGHPLSRLLGDLSISWGHARVFLPEPGGVCGTTVLLQLGYASFGAGLGQRGSVSCWMEQMGTRCCCGDTPGGAAWAAGLVRCPSLHVLSLTLFWLEPPDVSIGPSCRAAYTSAWDGGDCRRCFVVNFAWFHH